MKPTSSQVILLRGAPGVGKSTTLQALRDRLPGGAVIDVDHVWAMLGGVTWSPPEYGIALEMTAALVRGFLERGRCPVVVASPFERDALLHTLELLTGLRVTTLALVASPAELERRIAGRPPWGFRNLAEALRVNESLRGCAGAIDTSALGPRDVLSAVLTAMQRQLVEPGFLVPPAGITAASIWIPVQVVDPAKPPVILAPKINPATGERASLFVTDDPTYQAIVTEFRTVFGSGASVQDTGNKLLEIRKNDEDAEPLIRFEVARIFKPYEDAGRVRVDEVDVTAGPEAGWKGSLTVHFTLLATGEKTQVSA